MNKIYAKDFSHVLNVTGYMKAVENIVLNSGRSNLKILDMPAGNGFLADNLKLRGHEVTCADINSERSDYVFVNMEKNLPFEDCSFDAAICLEGIEHVIAPSSLISELCRVLKPNGFVVISMPNVQSLFSRLTFLLTGTFYQFSPEGYVHPTGRSVDRGHISPITFIHLNYLFEEHGLTPTLLTGDKIKKKILFPIYMMLWVANKWCLWIRSIRSNREDTKKLYSLMTGIRPILSRSLIAVWSK